MKKWENFEGKFQENKDWNIHNKLKREGHFIFEGKFQENKDWNYPSDINCLNILGFEGKFQENKDWNSDKSITEGKPEFLRGQVPRKQGLKLS